MAKNPSGVDVTPYRIGKIYIRDLSFKVSRDLDPSSDFFIEKDRLIVSKEVSVSHEELPDDKFSVVLALSIHISEKSSDEILHFEVEQGATFKMIDARESTRERLLSVDCPRAVFPFARELFYSCIGRSRAAAQVIDCVDFDELYAQIGAGR